MIKDLFKLFGYEIKKLNDTPLYTDPVPAAKVVNPAPSTETPSPIKATIYTDGRGPKEVSPYWPLPRKAGGMSDQEMRDAFDKFEMWHYEYKFEGGVSTPPSIKEAERPLQRFQYFMPYLLEANNFSLKGKRVLDIACNSGFWSFQCALLGAEVVGFDARPELIEQANLLKKITGIENVEFREYNFWKMTPEAFDGQFDIVLNLGILYHLSSPLEAMLLTRSMAKEHILVDTFLYDSPLPLYKLRWEQRAGVRSAYDDGIVAHPTRSSLDLVYKHIGAKEWFEIPIRSTNMPPDYLSNTRAAWLIKF